MSRTSFAQRREKSKGSEVVAQLSDFIFLLLITNGDSYISKNEIRKITPCVCAKPYHTHWTCEHNVSVITFFRWFLKMACPGCCSEVSIYVSLQTFRGNYDRNGIQTHSFDPPIYGRFIRLNPRGWKSHISMRLELYGCPWSKQFVGSVYYYLSVIFVRFYSYFKFCQELFFTITV